MRRKENIMTEHDDFIIEDAPDFCPTEATGGAQVIKEAAKVAPIKIKQISGTNWVFPFMTCQHGQVIEAQKCHCAIDSLAFLADDACYVINQENPTLQPTLCPHYKQKE